MKILIVFGTRPEAIKMVPLVKSFQEIKHDCEAIVCVTGQHRELLDQVLELFEIEVGYDLNIMRKNQDLYDITARIIQGMRDVLKETSPDVVLVHGDTTTSLAVALSAFYMQIPVGHVEAGLRTNNRYSPWPEEMNRQLISRISNYNFAPTPLNKSNLLKEGVAPESIIVTGNTVIDTLQLITEKIKGGLEIKGKLDIALKQIGYDTGRLNGGNRLVLITGHRRENFGEGFLRICRSLETLSKKYPSVDFLYPMHFNPNIREPINKVFAANQPSNLFFIEPLEYLPFVYLMERCYLILTDSGGIQEEAPGLGKPVLVMRDMTERPEGLEAGTVKLVGTDYDKIVKEVSILLDDKECYIRMSSITNPYGDGKASKRIVSFLMNIR